MNFQGRKCTKYILFFWITPILKMITPNRWFYDHTDWLWTTKIINI